MKKGFLSVILMMTACVSWAQNFQLHYRGIMGYATKLDKLNGGEVYTRSEAAHAHLFADVILLEIKTEARILGTVVGVMDKILSVGLKG